MLALVGSLAFAPLTDGNLAPSSFNPDSHNAKTESPTNNAFALVAYADENPNRAPGQTITFKLEDFGVESAWKVWNTDPEVDPNNVAPNANGGQRYLSVAYRFNLSCIGTNVESLTYTLEGDRVLFYTCTSTPQNKGEIASVEERGKSFTIPYDEQRTDPTKTWRALRASFPLEGELANLYDAVTSDFYSGTRDWDTEAHDRLNIMTLRKYANIIAQSYLTVTATFTDGSTQTKVYVIAPVDNLEEIMRAHTAALRAQSAALDESTSDPTSCEPIPTPQLFTLTELPETASTHPAARR